MARRSILYTPGDDREMMRKALSTEADAVVFDLEDAVAPDAKAGARETVADTLRDVETDTEVSVRINALDAGGVDDVRAVAGGDADPDAIVLPMVESTAETFRLGGMLEATASEAGITAVVETGTGVSAAPEIAASEYVDTLGLGAEDYAAQLGASRTTGGDEIQFARQQVVNAAAGAGIDAIDTVYTDIDDLEGLREDAERAVQFGFDGKIAIHPAQVEPINEAFTPPRERVEWAQRILEAEREASAAGKGAFEVDGQMIDPPLVRRARRIVDRAEAAGEL